MWRTSLRLLPFFEKHFCAVACASSAQSFFKIQQPKERRIPPLNEAFCPKSSPEFRRRSMDLMHHWQPCFRTVSAILIVSSTVVAKDAISSFHVQSDPSTDSLSSISLLGWLKTCPEDLAKHAGAFLLMAAR